MSRPIPPQRPVEAAATDHGIPVDAVDCQIHLWFTDRPDRPWAPDPWAGRTAHARQIFQYQLALSCSPATALDEMGVAGITAAVLAPLGVYPPDSALEADAVRDHPEQFVALTALDHRSPNVEIILARQLARGFRGVRFAPMDWDGAARGDYDPFLRAASRHHCPVFVNLPTTVPATLTQMVRNYPDITFVLDHLGLGWAPPLAPAPAHPFAALAQVCDLARHDNVAVKLTCAPTLSAQAFPFEDIFDPILRLVAAFGSERVLWGSDFTRTNALYSYTDGARYLLHVPELNSTDLANIYGRTVRRLLRWPVGGP